MDVELRRVGLADDETMIYEYEWTDPKTAKKHRTERHYPMGRAPEKVPLRLETEVFQHPRDNVLVFAHRVYTAPPAHSSW